MSFLTVSFTGRTRCSWGSMVSSRPIDGKYSSEEKQYFLPMGYNTSNSFTGDLPSTIYMVELRDSRFVHPTLQTVAHYIGNQITENLGIPLHVDPEPNRFDIKRGAHDITLKNG